MAEPATEIISEITALRWEVEHSTEEVVKALGRIADELTAISYTLAAADRPPVP